MEDWALEELSYRLMDNLVVNNKSLGGTAEDLGCGL